MPGCRLRATHSYISGQYGPMENWLWSPSETGQCQKDYKHSPLLFPFNLLLVSSDRSLSQAPRGSNHYIFLISYISKGSTIQVECIFSFGTHYTLHHLRADVSWDSWPWQHVTQPGRSYRKIQFVAFPARQHVKWIASVWQTACLFLSSNWMWSKFIFSHLTTMKFENDWASEHPKWGAG